MGAKQPTFQQIYGFEAIRNIMAQQNSQYQSVSYVKIKEQCNKRIDDIETEGQKVIDQYIELSKQDFQNFIQDATRINPNAIKEIELKEKQLIRNLIEFDKQMGKYDDIRYQMIEQFKRERESFQRELLAEVREHYRIDLEAHYPEYHQLPQSNRSDLFEHLQKHYAKKWYEQELLARQKGKTLGQNYQYDFTGKKKDVFERIIPQTKCQEVHEEIRQHLRKHLKGISPVSAVCCF